jgi:large subunit ribosomal protein L13
MDYHIDAKNKILGRLASEVALILQGKKSPNYKQNAVSGDRVFLANCDGIKVTGSKFTDKIYYKHTGYMGHLREKTFRQIFEKDPKKVMRNAVRHMLPKNFLNQKRLNNLVFVKKENKS